MKSGLVTITWTIFSAVVTLVAHNARADVLFIDLNDSPEEIAAATKAATARGEHLVVIPTRTPNQQAILDHLHSLIIDEDNLKDREESMSAAAYQTRKKILDDQIADLPNPVHLDGKTLISEINAESKAGHTFTAVVISGEHEVMDFFGENGRISKTELGEALTTNPIKNSLRSFYGWGCYDSVIAMAEWVKPLVPGLQMIAGFDGQAPKNTRQANLDFLSGALLQEKKITEASDEKRDVKNVEAMIRAIPGFNQTHGVVYTENACLSSTYGEITQEGLAQSCGDQAYDAIGQGYYDFYPMIFNPNVGQPVPCKTGSSWLRSYYDTLRDHEFCGNIPSPRQDSYRKLTGTADKVIRMIYFQSVLANFTASNASEIKKLSAIAQEHQPEFPNLDLTAPFSCGTQTGMSRQQIVLWINNLGGASASLPPAERDFVKSFQNKLNIQLTQLKCVPASWLEDPVGETPEQAPDSCFQNGT